MKKLLLALFLLGAAASFGQRTDLSFGIGSTYTYQHWSNASEKMIGDQTNGRHIQLGLTILPKSGRFAWFAQVAFNANGSRIPLNQSSDYDPNHISSDFLANSASLTLGIKKIGLLGLKNAYLSLGVRGEYAIRYNPYTDFSMIPLGPLSDPTIMVYKTYDFRTFNYGLSIAAGYNFQIFKRFQIGIEASVLPDISNQAYLHASTEYAGLTPVAVPELAIRNTAVQLSCLFHLLGKAFKNS